MAVYADERDLRLHGVHPDQHEDEGPPGTDIRMPGGMVGRKTRLG